MTLTQICSVSTLATWAKKTRQRSLSEIQLVPLTQEEEKVKGEEKEGETYITVRE